MVSGNDDADDDGFRARDLKDIPWTEINQTIDKLGEFAERVGGAWGKHTAPLRAQELMTARHSTYLAYATVILVVSAAAILSYAKGISSDATVGLLGAVVGYIFGRR